MNGQELDINSLKLSNSEVKKFSVEEVLTELERQQNGKRSWVANLTILIISLVVFYRIGLINHNPAGIVILLAVLFLHELGHWLGMRAFGYNNVQMFFIPFFGAAVSGQSRNVPAYQKAIVSLLGPGPGILMAGVTLAVYAVTSSPLFYQLTLMLLLINTFNLLPFFPLDGGRFMHDVLFCRNRYLELTFRIVAALCIAGIALLMGAWILLAFGVLGLFTVMIYFKLATVARQVKGQYPPAPEEDVSAPAPSLEDRTDIVQCVIELLHKAFPSKMPLKQFAGHVKTVLEQIDARPPKAGATAALLAVYGLCFVLAAVMLIGTGIAAYAKTQGQIVSSVVEFENADGTAGYKEVRTASGTVVFEAEVDLEQWLYHGPSKSFYADGQLEKEGLWHFGKWHGEWKEYDMDGSLRAVTQFDNGNFVFRKVRKDDVWTEMAWADLPFYIKIPYENHQNEQPKGPNR